MEVIIIFSIIRFYELGIVTCYNSKITSEIMNQIDIWYYSLDGGSARRKASTYTGQHNTQKDEDKRPCDERDLNRTHDFCPKRPRASP
jgi:hypothetical protein